MKRQRFGRKSLSLLTGGALLAPLAYAQTAAEPAAAALPEVRVSAEPATPDSLPSAYAGGQVARGARLGLLGNVDVMDTPFNVTSFTSDLIENQGARTVGEVLENDPSVGVTTSNGHAYENFRIRGFNVDQNELAINGMFGLAPDGHTPVEMFERVELLKGPNALFSGMAPGGGVGGVINLVPKRAGDAPMSRVTLGGQTSGHAGATFDLGRRLGEDKAWGIRVNGSYGDGETELDGQKKKREFLSAALDYRGNGLKASIDAYTSKESLRGGSPAMFWMTGPTVPAAPKGSVNQFPGAWADMDSKAVIARAEYAFNDQVSVFAGLGRRNIDRQGFINGTHVRNLSALGVSSTTAMYASNGYERSTSAEAGLRLNFNTASVAHEVVLQASHLAQEAGMNTTAGKAYTTSIYDPVYAAMPALPGDAAKASENTFSSLALVDTLSMLDDALHVTLGLRHQSVKTTNYAATGAVSGTPYDKSAVTPAVGVVFKPWGPNVSLYANYVQGLSKGDSISTPTYVRNYTFAPYKTAQKEVGVKWNAGAFTHTASLFEITKPMLLAVATSAGTDATDGGEKRVRGLEWNTFGEVARGLRLLGGISWMQGVQTRTAKGQYDGFDAVGVPRWQASLGAEWDTPVPGLTLTGRAMGAASQYLNAANTLKIPGWGVLDLGARYATKIAGRNTVFRLNVANALNRAYYNGSFSDTTPIATLGQPRTVSLSATVDF
ncbi:MAG: TonB-dependent siderophore receptor [Acidovorax sp.]